MSTELERIANALEMLVEQAVENEREDRPGTWEERWYVTSPEKGRVLYKGADEAYAGGRYWREHSTDPEAVTVTLVESKVYPDRVVPLDEWRYA